MSVGLQGRLGPSLGRGRGSHWLGCPALDQGTVGGGVAFLPTTFACISAVRLVDGNAHLQSKHAPHPAEVAATCCLAGSVLWEWFAGRHWRWWSLVLQGRHCRGGDIDGRFRGLAGVIIREWFCTSPAHTIELCRWGRGRRWDEGGSDRGTLRHLDQLSNSTHKTLQMTYTHKRQFIRLTPQRPHPLLHPPFLVIPMSSNSSELMSEMKSISS